MKENTVSDFLALPIHLAMKTCRTQFTALLTALLLGLAAQHSGAAEQLPGALVNVEARYTNFLPNDFEIYLYGDGLTVASVVETWNTNTLLGSPPAGMQWGTAASIIASVNTDPTSPAFGLNAVTIRWVGPARPALVGRLVQFGARLKIGAAVAHQEFWWTINGQKVDRPVQAQVIWHATPNGWKIELNNPTSSAIYVYGTRYFAPAAGSPLPTFTQLTAGISPAAFGAAGWTPLPLPGGAQVFMIPPQGHIFLRVPSAPLRPVVFQIATRDVPTSVLPLPGGTTGPNPNDFNGENGTMTIQTTRATQEFPEDLTGDGAVGVPDFNQLRSRVGTTSADQ